MLTMPRQRSKPARFPAFLFFMGVTICLFSFSLLAIVQRHAVDHDMEASYENIIEMMLVRGATAFHRTALEQGTSWTNEAEMASGITKITSRSSPEIRHDNSTTILFVHVGKAGGMTLREATYVSCLGNAPHSRPAPPEAVENCVNYRFSPDTVLPYVVQSVMHKWAFNSSHVQAANYFLFVLRNPVDRYISAFYYRHPDTCYRASCGRSKATLPFYRECFPTIEHLAQLTGLSLTSSSSSSSLEDSHESDNDSTDSPFRRSVLEYYGDKNQDLIQTCRAMAMASSQGEDVGGGPHFEYNYKYYAKNTMALYNETPVLVVRTEHEWEDMIDLDHKFGGTGRFHNLGDNFTHGDETLKNKTARALSVEGYHNLCCVLVKEIQVFQSILERAINLYDAVKEETIAEVHEKCGINNWVKWKKSCLQRVEASFESIRGTGYDNMRDNVVKVQKIFNDKKTMTSGSQ